MLDIACLADEIKTVRITLRPSGAVVDSFQSQAFRLGLEGQTQLPRKAKFTAVVTFYLEKALQVAESQSFGRQQTTSSNQPAELKSLKKPPQNSKG